MPKHLEALLVWGALAEDMQDGETGIIITTIKAEAAAAEGVGEAGITSTRHGPFIRSVEDAWTFKCYVTFVMLLLLSIDRQASYSEGSGGRLKQHVYGAIVHVLTCGVPLSARSG